MAKGKSPEFPTADQISISAADTKEANKRKRYVGGWYRWLVRDTENKPTEDKGKGSSLMTVCKLAALKDPNEANTAEKMTINHYVVHPLKNPLSKKQRVPRTAGMVGSFYRACGITQKDGKAIPDYPRIDENTRQYTFEGQPIEKSDYEKCADKCTLAVQQVSLEVCANPDKLLHGAPYAKLTYENEWPRLGQFRDELPEDAELVPADKFFDESETEEEEEPEFVEETEEEEKEEEEVAEEAPPPAKKPIKKPAKKGRK